MILGPHYVIDFDNFVIRVHESLSMVILAMGCKKFKGADEKHRIHKIFQFLDPAGLGTVSAHEWERLEQLWKETQGLGSHLSRIARRPFHTFTSSTQGCLG